MKKALLSLALVISMLLGVSPVFAMAADNNENQVISSQERYKDISGAWYEAAVNSYGYEEIFSNGDGNFYPSQGITRMEFVRLLHKALDININYFAETDISDYFDDVKNSDAGAGDLYDLVTTGIIDRAESFKPDSQLSREEMIHYIMEALFYATGGNYAIIELMPAPFDDDAQLDSEYKDEVYKAVVIKLIYGRGDNMLYPKQGATRAEAVTVADRLLSLLDSYSQIRISATAQEENGGLKMTLTIQNNSDNTITINHTSGQKYDFKIFDSTGESLYTWSADKMFIAALSTTEIKAGEKVEYTETLDSAAYSPIKAKASSVKAYIVGTSESFSIDQDGYLA